MADPFQALQDQSVSTFGIDVLDAPDQRLREIALRAQQGEALGSRDIRRLAQRQGIELDTARRAREVTGFGGAGVPVSTVDYLAGSRLDPRVQQAAAAEAVLSSNPLMQQARLQQAKDILDPVGAEIRKLSDPRAQALANYEIQQAAIKKRVSEGMTPEEAEIDLLSTYKIPENPATPAAPATSAVTAEPVKIKSLQERIAEGVQVKDPEEAVNARLRQRYGANTPVSMAAVRREREAMGLKQGEVVRIDPLTQTPYKMQALVDATGNVYGVVPGSAVKTGEGPFEKLDAEASKNIASWTAGGESQQTRTNIQQLGEAIKILRDPATKGASGPIVSLMPDWMRERLISTPSASVKGVVEQVAQQSLRSILGAQFTQKEGEAFLSRVFNLRFPEEENARRAEVLMGTIKRMADEKDAAAQYFQQTGGTLAGFTGRKMPTLAEIEAEVAKAGVSDVSVPPAVREAQTNAAARKAAYLAKFKQP